MTSIDFSLLFFVFLGSSIALGVLLTCYEEARNDSEHHADAALF